MIVEGAILGAFTVGETDTGWLLDVEDVSLEVPRELARVEIRAYYMYYNLFDFDSIPPYGKSNKLKFVASLEPSLP